MIGDSIIKSIKDNFKEGKRSFIWITLLFFAISIAWKFLPSLIPWVFERTEDCTEVGIPSWIFEAGNTLFSALAFGAMIITLLLQREDLKLQNQEMRETKNIMAKQLELAGISQVESTLFYMLGQHNNILNCFSFRTPNTSTILKGIDYINFLNDRIGSGHVYYLNESERINVSPYIHNLMQIFKYIDETEVLKSDNIDDEFKKRHKYCSMVTSSLSNNELILIDYYLSVYTGIELNRLCEIYALLENEINPYKSLNGSKYNLHEAKEYFKTDRKFLNCLLLQ
ncbi:MAG: hypothetical protein J6T28_09000 [Paludibacteraceae bacterium]|nr:hypothetical protein [Paludibacteraceae bacterium]